jgi:hypothetical protein
MNNRESFGAGFQLGFILPKAAAEHSAVSSGTLVREVRQSVTSFDSNSMFSSSHRVKI